MKYYFACYILTTYAVFWEKLCQEYIVAAVASRYLNWKHYAAPITAKMTDRNFIKIC